MPTEPKSRRHRLISIRWSLLKHFLLLVVLISGSLLVYSTMEARRAIDDLTRSLFNETSASVKEELARFFAPISKAIEIVGGMGESGVFSPDDAEFAGRLLVPVVSAIPQMSSVNTGDEEGNALILARRDDQWVTVEVGPRGGDARWREVDESGATIRSWSEATDFDPRTRPWYALGGEGPRGEVRWTKPYRFVPTGNPGITAVVNVDGPHSSYVLAFDILLEDLTRFAREITVPGGGLVFVLTDDGRLLVPPAGPAGDLRDQLLKDVNDLGNPLVNECVRRWGEDRTAGAFRVEQGGETWWCGFEPAGSAQDQEFWIAVVVPEGHLMGEHHRNRIALFYVTLSALGVALLMALLLSRSYSRPLGELVGHSKRLENLHTDVEVAVSSRLREVGQLADAQEKMRRALDSFARYVPLGVVRDLFDRGEAARIGGRDSEVTVLFTDIEGFTTIAESMSARDLTVHMSEYFDGIVGILHGHGATVDKFIGDAIMAFWGAPKEIENHSEAAVKAVIEIRAWLEDANRRWVGEGKPALPTRFGLASGNVTVGNVGAEQRLSYTVLGDPVNLACRLEELNASLGTTVLADERVRTACGDDYPWRDAGAVLVRGKKVPVHVFELMGPGSLP